MDHTSNKKTPFGKTIQNSPPLYFRNLILIALSAMSFLFLKNHKQNSLSIYSLCLNLSPTRIIQETQALGFRCGEGKL